MPNISKPKRRNLNEAFIAISDDDENLLSNESARSRDTPHSSIRNLSNDKKKTSSGHCKRKSLFPDNMLSCIEETSYSTAYLERNFNLQSPSEFYPKNRSQPKQREKLKRSESLSADNESQRQSKNLYPSKTRRSLDSNNHPLVNISNTATPEFSKTFRRSKFERNSSERVTPKTSKSKPSSEKEFVEKNSKFNKLDSRMSYPGCTRVKLNLQRHPQDNAARNTVLDTNIEASDLYTQDSVQTVRNFSRWTKVECSTPELFTNLENVVQTGMQALNISNIENEFEDSTCFQVCSATNDFESKINCRVTFSTPNSATPLPSCSFVPRKVLNTDINLSETQELWLQNDLSEAPNRRQTRIQRMHNGEFRNTYLNYLDFFKTVGNNQDLFNPYSKSKLQYYDMRKVDLVQFECKERNEGKGNKFSSSHEATDVGNIKDTEKRALRMNLNIVKPENLSENELPEVKFPSESSARNCSPNRQINQFAEVKTPESPISALINKNLSELFISKI